jgi:hypothetical protein
MERFVVDLSLQERGEVLTERRVRLPEAEAHRLYDALEALLLAETGGAQAAPGKLDATTALQAKPTDADTLCDATANEVEQAGYLGWLDSAVCNVNAVLRRRRNINAERAEQAAPNSVEAKEIEARLAEHYVRKFAAETGRAEAEYRGKIWVAWDDEAKVFDLRGESIPAHPDLASQYPNGWSMLDNIDAIEAITILLDAKTALPESAR